MTCKGYKKNGERCGTPYGLSYDGYCRWHKPDNLCCGKRNDGVKCKAPRKRDYNYCCADHDPINRPFYIAPSVFKIDYLRNAQQDGIVQRYGNQDIYHGRALPTPLNNDYQLDHKFELQSGAYAVREAEIQDAEEQEIVIKFLRDEVLNQDPNLCFTRTTTNQVKGTAVKNLLDDMRTGHWDERSTFTNYMLAAKARDNTKVSRAVTMAIRAEMRMANKYCQYKLEDESETPSFEAVKQQFMNLNIAMRD
jgi:hypothetical protein